MKFDIEQLNQALYDDSKLYALIVQAKCHQSVADAISEMEQKNIEM